MNESGHDGPGAIVTASDDVPSGASSAHGMRQQGTAAPLRHRHLRKRVLGPAVATATAAGVAAALLTAPASHAPTAFAAVTGALANTSAGSYSFRLDSTMKFEGREVSSDVVSGAYDPEHGLGTELLATRTSQGALEKAQIRFTGKYVYTRVSSWSVSGKPWNKSPVPPAEADAMQGHDVGYGFVTDWPVSPAGLSAVLRSAGALRQEGPASGLGWTGTRYAFTAHFPREKESVTGAVYIDQQGRVRRLVTLTTLGLRGRITTDRDLMFGNFGAPVPVTAPLARQVGYTSTPYWGFYF